MNITRNQWLAIVGVVMSAVMTSTAFLTDAFGATVAHSIIGAAGFANMVLNGVVAVLSGQGQQVRDVAAMPGVNQVVVNDTATQTLAQVATSADQPKVVAADVGTRATLIETAKGN